MAIETKQVKYAKELDDAMICVVELVKDIKAGKSAGEIAGETLGNLMEAVKGIDQVGAELAADKAVAFETIGYRVGDLMGALVAGPAAGQPAV